MTSFGLLPIKTRTLYHRNRVHTLINYPRLSLGRGKVLWSCSNTKLVLLTRIIQCGWPSTSVDMYRFSDSCLDHNSQVCIEKLFPTLNLGRGAESRRPANEKFEFCHPFYQSDIVYWEQPVHLSYGEMNDSQSSIQRRSWFEMVPN